jgi:hypothetical protein
LPCFLAPYQALLLDLALWSDALPLWSYAIAALCAPFEHRRRLPYVLLTLVCLFLTSRYMHECCALPSAVSSVVRLRWQVAQLESVENARIGLSS